MKNNKIFNRTFKVSLVAAALGLVNSALAADVACNVRLIQPVQQMILNGVFYPQ